MAFLNETGVAFLLGELQVLMEASVTSKIISTIDENSTNLQIPGAAAVREFVLSAISDKAHLGFEKVDALPETGDSSIIYLVENDGDDEESYTMWLYFSNDWHELGKTIIHLDNYWSKDELQPMTNTEIKAVLDEIFK